MLSQIFGNFTGGDAPDYNYTKFIKNPQELGINSKGSLPTLANNIKGMKAYIDMLLVGKSSANKLGKDVILGSKYFMETGTKCVDYMTGKEVDRNLYISNTPSGVIPGLTDMTGFKASEFKGLVPGMVQNINAINPMKLFRVFQMSLKPKCAKVSLPVIDENHKQGKKSGYVPLLELEELANEDDSYKKYLTSSMMKEIESIKSKDTEGMTANEKLEKESKLGYLMYLRMRLSGGDIEEQQKIIDEHNKILKDFKAIQDNYHNEYSMYENIMLVLMTLILLYITFHILHKLGR